ncbi:DeoR/GlpR family transcriptional regulator of sugar metabolism [Erwinia rhapontici]|nr:DeoR/GlpR family transcriptional regulator of sugar metabolism [Erwinia rhapontici]
MLDVTVMTIRRDIEQLSARGVIMSTRGGVKSRETPLRMPAERIGAHTLIRAALSYLGDSKVIYLDGGKLTLELATFFPYSDEMTIVTNDFAIAQHVMTHSTAALFFIGGKLSRHDNTFHQSVALETLQSINFDKAFIAPESWSDKGVFHHDEYRMAYYSAIINVSRKCIMLAENKNYGSNALYKMFSLTDMDMVITDLPSSEVILSRRVDPLKLHPVARK